jgi:phospholipase/carboxylesterase
VLAAACAGRSERGPAAVPSGGQEAQGRLLARPTAVPDANGIARGLQPLGFGDARDGLLYVPRETKAPAPFLLLLHGATGSAKGITSRLEIEAQAEGLGLVVLAPDSRGRTWDVIGGAFGPDVAFIDRALARTFAKVSIDPRRLAVGGFSDGASYALSLGVINGDLWSHVLAFSPGFLVADATRGRPRIFMTHGTSDPILPIDNASRRLAPQLRNAGYALDYREFDGGHLVPKPLARAGFEWLTGGGGPRR